MRAGGNQQHLAKGKESSILGREKTGNVHGMGCVKNWVGGKGYVPYIGKKDHASKGGRRNNSLRRGTRKEDKPSQRYRRSIYRGIRKNS